MMRLIFFSYTVLYEEILLILRKIIFSTYQCICINFVGELLTFLKPLTSGKKDFYISSVFMRKLDGFVISLFMCEEMISCCES